MDKSLLIRIAGFPATLIHGDSLILDRYLWLKRQLPLTLNKDKLLDIGCGSGTFTIGANLRGYKSLGLTWDERDRNVAEERAELCKASSATFEAVDVRHLDARNDFIGKFSNEEKLYSLSRVLPHSLQNSALNGKDTPQFGQKIF